MSKCSPMNSDKRQIAVKKETVCGAGATFAVTDFLIRPSDISTEVDMGFQDDDTLSATMSPSVSTPGKRTSTVKFAGKLVGSGVPANLPEIDAALIGCGMVSGVIKSISIGAITDGPFIEGETVTGGTSSATGIVMRAAYAGDTKLYIRTATGTFASTETITGSVSAAVATSSSAAVAAGTYYAPSSSSNDTVALRDELDGFYQETDGAVGTFTIAADAAASFKAEFTFSGKQGEHGDAAMTSPIDRYETAFPTFRNALCVMDRGLATEFQPIVKSMSFDYKCDTTMRDDANEDTGLIAGKRTKRVPTLVLSVEAMLKADCDVYDKMKQGDICSIGLCGVSPDSKVALFGQKAQITSISPGNKDKVATFDITYKLTKNSDAGDDEFFIVFIDG